MLGIPAQESTSYMTHVHALMIYWMPLALFYKSKIFNWPSFWSLKYCNWYSVKSRFTCILSKIEMLKHLLYLVEALSEHESLHCNGHKDVHGDGDPYLRFRHIF